MRIGIDLMSFRPGQMGGSEVHMRSLLGELQEIDSENEYVLLMNSRNRGAVEVKGGNFAKHVVRSASHSFYLRNMPLLNNAPLLKRQISRLGLNVMHRPFTVIYPRLDGVPEVVTIADLQFEEFPENFSRAQLYSRKRLYRKAAEGAEAVIAISEFTKRSIVRHYGISPERIHVVHEAAGDEFGRRMGNAEAARALAKLGLKPGYVYYPSAGWTHKNHWRLFEAMRILKQRGSGMKLVLSGLGKVGHLAQKSANLGIDVSVLQGIDKSLLPLLYRGAALMAFPSLYEGFGLPLVEAMKSGCPVACGKVASIPEVCGGAAAYFDPLSPEDIADKIEAASSNGRFRKRLIAMGRKQAAKFSWGKCARQTLALLEKIGGK